MSGPATATSFSKGHPILCMPTGGRGSRSNLVGASALETDPAVESAGVDPGFAPNAKTLRAPDVAVGNVPDAPGWVKGVPPLAVEYSDTGQDEDELQARIHDLLDERDALRLGRAPRGPPPRRGSRARWGGRACSSPVRR